MVIEVDMIYAIPDLSNKLELPIALSPVVAGFPSPAEDYADRKIDLNTYLVKHPAATFFARVEGESMQDRGIFPGDLVVVDKSLFPKNGDIVLAALNKEFTIKEFLRDKNNVLFLLPANKRFQKIQVTEDDEFQIWGVITSVIHVYL